MTALATAIGAGVAATGLAVAFARRRRTDVVARYVAARLGAPDRDGVVRGATAIEHDRSATHAVLLLHGFGDTPQSLAGLAADLADVHGWTVRVPLLPGHGRTLEAFAASRADDWLAAARQAHDALRTTHAHVSLVGLSMGGALATVEAARVGDACEALVLLAPYLTPTIVARRVAATAPIAQAFVPWFAPAADQSRSIIDPDALAQNLGYGTSSPRLVRELVRVADRARAAAAAVRAPVRIVHGRHDYRVPAPLAATHPALFTAAAAVTLDWLDDTGHVVTVDRQRARVWAMVGEWLAGRGVGGRADPGA